MLTFNVTVYKCQNQGQREGDVPFVTYECQDLPYIVIRGGQSGLAGNTSFVLRDHQLPKEDADLKKVIMELISQACSQYTENEVSVTSRNNTCPLEITPQMFIQKPNAVSSMQFTVTLGV